ncbi:hypothetical protein MCHI_000147 [Candidatus Magnetoovum chiemensis]|nr:hypothetical protein MCHI_000147 [Candidatus Magnetoovum chiemensis]
MSILVQKFLIRLPCCIDTLIARLYLSICDIIAYTDYVKNLIALVITGMR